MVTWGLFEVLASSWTLLFIPWFAERVLTIANFSFCRERWNIPTVSSIVTCRLLVGLLGHWCMDLLLLCPQIKGLQNNKGVPGVGRPSIFRCLSQWELLLEVNKSIYSAPFYLLVLSCIYTSLWSSWRMEDPYLPGLLTVRCKVHSDLV
jgi:hypothetical protein